MVKFVKVRFPSSTKEYDYICDLEDVKKGDYVYVDTRHGTKTVRVLGIFYGELDDMPLPKYAYKKISGKSNEDFSDFAEETHTGQRNYSKSYKKSSYTKQNTGIWTFYPESNEEAPDPDYELINEKLGVWQSKKNPEAFKWKHLAVDKDYIFLYVKLSYIPFEGKRYGWVITDNTNIKVGDYVYVPQNTKPGDSIIVKVERVLRDKGVAFTYDEFCYVHKVVEPESLTKAKLHMTGLNKSTIVDSLKIAGMAILVLLFLYWYLFTPSGYEFRLQGARLDEMMPRKTYIRY